MEKLGETFFCGMAVSELTLVVNQPSVLYSY